MTNHPHRSKSAKPLKVGETVIYRGETFLVQSAPDTGRISIYNGKRGTLSVWRSTLRRV